MTQPSTIDRLRPLLIGAVAVVALPFLLRTLGLSLNTGTWMLGLAVAATALAYIIYFEILKRSGATNLMLVTFLVPVSAILLGVLTACGGGVVRDVMLGSVPAILQRSELYATAAFAGGASFVLLELVTADPLASLGALLIGGGVCDLARRRGWMLPTEPKWRPSRVHRR